MKGALASLALAVTALAGSLAVNATVIDEPAVNDNVILEGMPRSLSQFGFFIDGAQQNPNYGVFPYRLNTALYSDGADKLRFIYLPNGAPMQANAENGEGLLQFPVGSAIIKTFAFGEGADRRLIETRVLLHREEGWVALPYRWNEEQTEATLALAGARIPMTRPDGAEISYRIPNKNECKTCHSKDGVVTPIGPAARNLSGEWFAKMVDAGAIAAIPQGADTMPVFGAGGDPEAQARAYLDVNCAHCHRPGGGASNSGLDLRWEQNDPHAIGIRKPPVAAGRGAGGHKVSIAPGDPDASIIVYRMESVEPGVAMPELGRSTVDEAGVAAVRDWIAGMDPS